MKKAVEIISAECFGAMSVANLLNGRDPTPEWEIVHNNSWVDIVKEAKDMGVDTDSLNCAVTDTPVINSATYLYACGKMSDEGRKLKFNADIRMGEGKWKPVPDIILNGWPAHVKLHPR